MLAYLVAEERIGWVLKVPSSLMTEEQVFSQRCLFLMAEKGHGVWDLIDLLQILNPLRPSSIVLGRSPNLSEPVFLVSNEVCSTAV